MIDMLTSSPSWEDVFCWVFYFPLLKMPLKTVLMLCDAMALEEQAQGCRAQDKNTKVAEPAEMRTFVSKEVAVWREENDPEPFPSALRNLIC